MTNAKESPRGNFVRVKDLRAEVPFYEIIPGTAFMPGASPGAILSI